MIKRKKPAVERGVEKQKTKSRFQFFNIPFLIVAGMINATGVILFLQPGAIIDGGISGLSQFLSSQTFVHISIFLVVINVPLFFMGFRKLGFNFIIYSLISICMYSLTSYFYISVFKINNALYELIRQDMFLAAIFGGVISGLGSGLTIRYGGAIDGVEVMAVLYAKKIGLSVGQFVMVFNMIMYIAASAITKNLLIGCYSVIAYAVGLKVVDFVVDGFDKGKACIIITKNSDILASEISKELKRGITLLDSRGYFSQNENTVLYCVVNRFEIVKVKSIINRLDPAAFVAINDVSEVLGNKIKFSLKKQEQTINTDYFPDGLDAACGADMNDSAMQAEREGTCALADKPLFTEQETDSRVGENTDIEGALNNKDSKNAD